MSISTKLDDVEYFALNVCDLTRLSPAELLLVQDKISSRELIKISKQIDGTAVLLRSTIKGYDYRNSHLEKQKIQLKAMCELIWKYSRVRSYYRKKNQKKFYLLKFKKLIKLICVCG